MKKMKRIISLMMAFLLSVTISLSLGEITVKAGESTMDNKDVDTLGIPAFKKKKVKRMKVMKGQGLLYIFNILKEKGRVKKEEIINALEITDLSFWRYIQEIKAFIYNFNLPYELIYDRKNEIYILQDNE